MTQRTTSRPTSATSASGADSPARTRKPQKPNPKRKAWISRELERLLAQERQLEDAIRQRRGKELSALERYCPHTPTAKQAEFLAADELEVFFGGSAGGGKSDALLMAALQHVHIPGYSALVLRRTYKDLALPGAIMDRAHTWLRTTDALWSEQDKRYTFPSGATLTFGFLDSDGDKYRYQGAELQFLGVDELTQFHDLQYRYLLSRLRRVQGHNVPIRARSAGNPGGIGHDWVHRRFVDPATRTGRFVPATLDDNPHLDADEYRRSLALLDPTLQKQLLDGIWVRDGSGLVYRQFDTDRNCIDALPGDV